MPTVEYRCDQCDCEHTEFYSIHEEMPEELDCRRLNESQCVHLDCTGTRKRVWAGRSPSIGQVPGAGGSPSRGSL